MEAEDILWILPYAIIIGILYSIYAWKTARGRSLLEKARTLQRSGNTQDGVILLKEALWKANEKPSLERSIISELGQAYQSRDIVFDSNDYLLLITQFEELSKKSSTKAIEELKKVQALKKRLIDRMPNIL